VSDFGNNTIRKVTRFGQVTTIAGQAGISGSTNAVGTNALFFHPLGIAVDSVSNLYVADYGNHLIRKVSPFLGVSTLAGSAGVFGFTNGTGTAAQFYEPEALAVDQAGNVYVADTGNAVIRMITAGGVVTTFAGSPGSLGGTDAGGTNARFYQPAGIAVNGAGNLYVADYFNNTIRQITPGGVVTTLAGSAGTAGSADGVGSAARLSAPQGVAVSGTGIIYVADTANGAIRAVTVGGTVTTFAGSPSAGSASGLSASARFYNPQDVALDSSHNIYLADTLNNVIRKITPSGVVSILAGTPGISGSADGPGYAALFSAPQGVAVDSSRNIYVADAGNNTIRKISFNGTVVTLAGSAGIPGNADGTGTGAHFNAPQGVAVDAAGNVYVADTWNHTIRKITPGGICTTFAGLAGAFGAFDGTNSHARFNNPAGIAVDNSGNVFVADTFNHTIRKITPAGVGSTLAGLAGTFGSADGTNSSARFFAPRGVAVDVMGNIYVSDSGNHTLRALSPSGSNWVVTTVAGYPAVIGSADGSAAVARFFQPSGIVFDNVGEGTLFIADSGNNTIRFSGLPFLISDLVVNARPSSATITWNTTSNATSQVAYGTTPAYGLVSSLTTNSAPSTSQAILLTGLLNDTVYYFQASSTSGTATITTNGSFLTDNSIIVVSSQARFSGTWTVDSAAPDRYTNYYEFTGTTTGSDTATAVFRPNIPVAAAYDVYVWYSASSNRSAMAPVTVGYNGGSTEVFVNETVNGGSWQRIANGVPFAAGTNGFVRLGNGSGENNRVVIADAVKFTYSPAQDAPTNGTVPGYWANFFFGTNAVNAGLDPNGNGYSIYQDYVLGISPVDPGSGVAMSCQPISGGGVQVTFSPFESGRIYELSSTASIVNPAWTNLNLPVTSDVYGNGVITVSNPAGAAFYRLVVRMAP
jgi:sugar lactone lactonase YvrE